MPKQSYGNESISALKGADRVRKRPGVIFGSDGIDGCQHSFFEILSNSIDEARDGFGDKIIITKFKDNSMCIEDFGRGIPVDFNQNEQRYNYELVFCELYAGGKYKNDDDNYEYSLGLNGLGLCATQYSSEYMQVEILRDNKKYYLFFEKGENVDGLKSDIYKGKQTGTKIKWKPDLSVFTDIDISEDYFRTILKQQAVVNQGLLFVLNVEENDNNFREEKFYYELGIKDYIKEIKGDDALCDTVFFESEKKGRDREDKPDYKVKMNFAFTFSNKVKQIEYYHNSSFLEHGGSPEKAVKTSFVSVFDNYLKVNNKYLKNESKITFIDIEESLVLVSSSFSTQTSYENQTKKSITNKFIYASMVAVLKEKLSIFTIENSQDATKIAEQILINKRSRENAEKTRLNIKKKLSGNLDIANRVQKFVDCRSKDLNKREIFIVEGDSALGACKLGRNAEFQAIIPVRGKILNCLKAELSKIFKNDIILDIIKVLGCGVEVDTKNKEIYSFSLENLKWNKIIICTDADVDGFQIRTLILAMIYKLTPTLITKGFVYIAESPLFEINTKNNIYFAYTEKEKNKILKSIDDTKYTIQRSKGLGENEPDMMWLTTMNPETRRLIKVTQDELEEAAIMFDVLLGDNLSGRKDFIAEKGHKYIDLIDLS
ncbi:MAG: toprim domain-containing protein [Oscillospiraceae bacterium]